MVTHDLDFGALLAITAADGPSVVQLRGGDALAETWVSRVNALLAEYETYLSSGALLVAHIDRERVRLLPLRVS